MTGFEWYPKMYGAGDIDGSGLRKLLGASHHDPLALLVRETIQNSWDASLPHDGTQRAPTERPSWTFELRDLDEQERQWLTGAFDRLDPPGTTLRQQLSDDRLRVIEISDRGTSGLGGPIRPDLPAPRGLTTDFVDLVFNIGAPQDTDGGGGTYGFGKIAAFGVSSCATVLYRTQPLVGVDLGVPGEHRLIGSTIGANFDHEGRRYTGRHWWGRIHEDWPQPLLADQAIEVAERLFKHPFSASQTGTSILILQPDLADRSDEEAMQHVVDAVLWNAWPKLVPTSDNGPRPMDLRVIHQGLDVPVPDPERTQPFSGFVDALRNVRARAAGQVPPEPIGPWTLAVREDTFDSARPIQLVGHVAVATTATGFMAEDPSDEDEIVSARHFEGPAHHLALLREPELVVRYLEGPPLKSPGTQWCGVFKPVRELDHAFAEAEPPSHDDWLDGRVSNRRDKTFVRRGRTKGPNELFANLHPRPAEETSEGPMQHLAAVADALGHMLTTGQRPTARRPGRPGKPRQRLLSVGDSVPVLLADGTIGIRVAFTTTKSAVIGVDAAVALAGGGADVSADLEDRRPLVLAVTRGTEPVEGDPGAAGPQRLAAGEWTAWIRNDGGAALAVDITAAEEN